MQRININDLVHLVGDEMDKWPMMKDTSNFFINKFNSMNYLTVGLEKFPYQDFLVNSKIISNWHIIALDSSDNILNNSTNIDKIKTIEKLSREFAEYNGEDKDIYFGMEQFIDYDITKVYHIAKENLRQDTANLIENMESVEILRIDSPGNERWVLSTVFDAGFLPSVLYIRFIDSPEKCVLTRNTIGHLRMLGYGLLYVHEDKYIFYFTNNSSYDLFNVCEISLQNPLINKCIKHTIDTYKETLSKNTLNEAKNENREDTNITPVLLIKLNKFY